MAATEPMTIESAADSLLMPDTPDDQEDDLTAQPDDTDEAPDEDQTEPDADEDDDEPEGDDPEADDEDEEQDAGKKEQTFTVKVDGEEVSVTLDDLKQSFSGQKYIQKGMKETAESRKQTEQLYADLNAEREQLTQFVQQFQQGGMIAAPKPPTGNFQSDPIGFMEQKIAYDEQMQAFQQQQAQIQQLTQQGSAAQEKARKAYVAEQARTLVTLIPEFADADKAGEITRKISKAAMDSYGFTQEEIAGVTDARHVQVLNDARQWRELQASKAEVTERVKKTARPVLKSSGKSKSDPAEQARAKQRAKLRDSGSLDDAVSLIFGN